MDETARRCSTGSSSAADSTAAEGAILSSDNQER